MIVCHCHRVSDQQVTAACASSDARMRSIACSTRAGTSCGGCVKSLREVIKAYAAAMTVTAGTAPADAA